MSQWEKLLEKIRNNPKSVTFDKIQKVLLKCGFKCRQPSGGSSHYTFYNDKGKRLTIPKHSPYVKECYIKLAMEILEAE